MTFILSLANKDFVAQISDRRLTSGAIIVEGNSNKSTVLKLNDSRFLMGYTGLAKCYKFETQQFLTDSIFASMNRKAEILPVIEDLTKKLTEEFSQNIYLKNLPSTHKKLTIMLTGYLDFFSPPIAAKALITNFQDFKTGMDLREAKSEFTFDLFNEKRPYSEPIIFVQRVGAWQGMTKEHEENLRQLLLENSSVKHILNKGIGIVRNIADSPLSKRYSR